MASRAFSSPGLISYDRRFAKPHGSMRTSTRLARRLARAPRPERPTQSNSQGPLRTLNRPTRSLAECLLLAMNGHLSDLRSDTFAIALSQQFAAAGRRLRCRHKQIVMLFTFASPQSLPRFTRLHSAWRPIGDINALCNQTGAGMSTTPAPIRANSHCISVMHPHSSRVART
jgi:hypothetical protein